MLWRALLAGVVIVCAAAGTTSVAGLLQFKQFASDIGSGVSIPDAPIRVANPGQSQTLLVVGSDHRAGEPFQDAHSDTMMLVRLDPNSSTINVISIPRDLEVDIPGYGTDKLNAAYPDGGTKLLTKTIRAAVFPHFHPNHIIDVNFKAFRDLVNAIGCVYGDIDHRYYNDTRLTDYSSINIQPGYQKLCGAIALSFVRFRHTDSDIVRNARQQDFVRWAKEQYSLSQIFANRDRLLRIFGHNAETDHNLHTADGIENLFKLVAFSDGHTIKQTLFPAQEQPCLPPAPCYVTATASAEAAAWKRFMTPTPQKSATAASHPNVSTAAGGRHGHHAQRAPTGLIADVTDAKAQVAQLTHLKIPVYYPGLILSGSEYCLADAANCPLEVPSAGSYPRAYTIRDRRGHRYPSYRMTLEINPSQGLYYGVQGTTWLKPPLLDNPTETKVVNGRTLELFADGGRLTTVAWRTPTAVYWISNTLNSYIPNREMVAIAASLTRGG
ncbi:MAG: LCP family protein [Solirubrobacteraceae bacterium]